MFSFVLETCDLIFPAIGFIIIAIIDVVVVII
jgi:hypothetical protein